MFARFFYGFFRSRDGLKAWIALRDNPHCTLEDIQTLREPESEFTEEARERVRKAAKHVFGVAREKVVLRFDDWLDRIRKRYQPMADMAAVYGLPRRVFRRGQLGLYLNLERSEFRRAEIARKALVYAPGRRLPLHWILAITNTEEDAAAFAEIYNVTKDTHHGGQQKHSELGEAG